MQTPTVLLLSAAENDENIATNNRFVANLNSDLLGGVQVDWRNYHATMLEMSTGSIDAYLFPEMRPLTDYKAVYFKSYFRHHEQATAIAETLAAHNVTFIGSELQHYIPAYKLSQLARLARAGVQIPKTIYLSIEHYEPYYEKLQEKLGDVFVFKAIDGSTGDDNYLVRSREELQNIVAQNQGRHFIAQAFVANDSDLRLIVLGDEVRLVIERKRKDDSTHLNNTSQGASATLIPIESVDKALIALSLQAAQIMKRDVAGVDIMLEQGTGEPYVLEVNASPQIASGAFEAEKREVYARYFQELANSEA